MSSLLLEEAEENVQALKPGAKGTKQFRRYEQKPKPKVRS
jgi:hypothetical protein